MKQKIKPYSQEGSKKEQVESMFDNIAHRYDGLNRFLSLGIDKIWRKKTIASLEDSDEYILDVATGTADMAIASLQNHASRKIQGIDVSQGMLDVGFEKLGKLGLSERISLLKADSEKLPFDEDTYDAAMVAFGVRNFENLEAGLGEMLRVIKPGGKVLILEFTKPRILGFKQLFHFYFRFILPIIGRFTSKDPRAYRYLFESVQAFPDFEHFVSVMEKCGYEDCNYKSLSLGICAIYTGYKR